MAFQLNARGGRHQPSADINMVPLIDVMLVLVIIFMVTAPLMTHAVKINLPKASSELNQATPHTISVSIDAKGALFWNREPLRWEDLAARLSDSAAMVPQPELQLRADENIAYKKVMQVMSTAAKAGMTRVGFVTDPAGERRP